MTGLGQFLAQAAGLTPLGEQQEAAQVCALCGELSQQVVSNAALIKPTTAGIADTFRFSNVTCGHCAACFQESLLLAGGIIATSDAFYKPLAKGDSDKNRPAWRDVLRWMPEGALNVSIITTNTKRRLWTKARLSAYGEAWQPLFVDGNTDRLLTIKRNELLTCLDFVEEVYAQGFSKEAILNTLHSSPATCLAVGLRKTMEYEEQLQGWRENDALYVAVFAAQREI